MSKLFQAMAIAAALRPNNNLFDDEKVRVRQPEQKIKFTDEEYEWLQTLSKKEKKRAVKELREKYSAKLTPLRSFEVEDV